MRQIRTKFFAHIRRRKNKKPDHHWKNQEVGGGEGDRKAGRTRQTLSVLVNTLFCLLSCSGGLAILCRRNLMGTESQEIQHERQNNSENKLLFDMSH